MGRGPAPLLALAGIICACTLAAWSRPAAAERPTVLPGNMPQLSQGRGSTAGFAPAPVPNPDAVAPRSQRDPNAIQLSPGLARPGIGQPDGSGHDTARGTYSRELERVGGRTGGLGSALVPSLNLRMPMQVELGKSRP